METQSDINEPVEGASIISADLSGEYSESAQNTVLVESSPKQPTSLRVKNIQENLFKGNNLNYGYAYPQGSATVTPKTKSNNTLHSAIPDFTNVSSPSLERKEDAVKRTKIHRSMSAPLLPDWQKLQQFQARLDEVKKANQQEKTETEVNKHP